MLLHEDLSSTGVCADSDLPFKHQRTLFRGEACLQKRPGEFNSHLCFIFRVVFPFHKGKNWVKTKKQVTLFDGKPAAFRKGQESSPTLSNQTISIQSQSHKIWIFLLRTTTKLWSPQCGPSCPGKPAASENVRKGAFIISLCSPSIFGRFYGFDFRWSFMQTYFMCRKNVSFTLKPCRACKILSHPALCSENHEST